MPERRFFTSDLHFGHANIIKYANRPYANVDEMNNDLVRRWNAVVTPNDTVWILGDLCMGKLDESLLYVGDLNGFKRLIPGNHDRMFGCTGRKYANMVQKYLDGGIDKVEASQVIMSRRGYDVDGWELPAVLACHFPFAGDHEDQTEDRFQGYRPKERKGLFLVHGHTHGLWRKNNNMVDVGVDAWGGYPVSFEDVGELFGQPQKRVERLTWEKGVSIHGTI